MLLFVNVYTASQKVLKDYLSLPLNQDCNIKHNCIRKEICLHKAGVRKNAVVPDQSL